MAFKTRPLSEDQMRRIWALIDILTSLKRRANHPPPTAELILRKFDALSLPACARHPLGLDGSYYCRATPSTYGFSPRQVCGMSQAVRVFPEDTASEVAHVHACESVVSAAAVETASFAASQALRLGLEHLAVARARGIPLCPIATDRHLQAYSSRDLGRR